MTRSRRRALGLAVSAAVHVFAFVVLTRVVVLNFRTRLDASAMPVIQVEILHTRDGLGRISPQAADQLSALAPAAPGIPQPPPPPPPPQPPEVDDDSAATSVVAQNAPLDIDPLFRVPFRDAVAQADAALRAGLSCAHVDLQQLPQDLLDLCAAADRRLKAVKQAPVAPEGPPPGDDRA